MATGGGDGQMARAVGQRIVDVPQVAVFFFADHFEVGYGGEQHRVPVHEALAAIDQALFIQTHEHVAHGGRRLVVHREVFARPVDRCTETTHLIRDRGAGLLLPLPHALEELLAAEVVARHALCVELAFDDDLRSDARVVGARHPQRVLAEHAVIAGQAVHDGLVERVAHVKRARDVRRRQLDREILAVRVEGGRGVGALFPFRAPVGFDGVGFEAFCKRRGRVARGVAHVSVKGRILEAGKG
ncbi:hypothetical protein OKW28_006050 [Paraburkholderia sp. 40]